MQPGHYESEMSAAPGTPAFTELEQLVPFTVADPTIAVYTTTEAEEEDRQYVSDSALGEDLPVSSTASLSSSVVAYPERHGRRYAKRGNWFVPNDQAEQERMDILHEIYVLVLKRPPYSHYLTTDAPRILDVGTGTGKWAIDIADQYRNGEVVGTDLSPIQPNIVPLNCSFLVDDAEKPWEDSKTYHLIHFRNMEGAFKDWKWIYRQALTSLEPGGVVQTQAYDCNVYAQQGAVPDPIQRWIADLCTSAYERGTPIDVADRHKIWMEDVGFEDVREEAIAIPLGEWAEQEGLKSIGEWNLIAISAGLEAYGMDLFLESRYSLEEFQVRLALVRNAYMESCRTCQLFSKIPIITARKPHHL